MLSSQQFTTVVIDQLTRTQLTSSLLLVGTLRRPSNHQEKTMAHKLPAIILLAVLLALGAPLVVVAGDPDMLQDVCVADYHSLKGRKSSRSAFTTTVQFICNE